MRRPRTLARLALAVLPALLAPLLALGLPAAASAKQLAQIEAGFSPYELGRPTALSLGFQIEAVGGGLPSALTAITFRYPRKLGLASTELGLAHCNPKTLRVRGPRACPGNSLMGRGSALAKFQIGPEVDEEAASIALIAGPSAHGYIQMLISATGAYPVSERIVMPTILYPGRLQITVPRIESIPEGPDIAVTEAHVSIGGHLTYHERRHGHLHAFHPKGILLPRRCPKAGFPFSATFSFTDGTTAQAQTVVPCRSGRSARSRTHGALRAQRPPPSAETAPKRRDAFGMLGFKKMSTFNELAAQMTVA